MEKLKKPVALFLSVLLLISFFPTSTEGKMELQKIDTRKNVSERGYKEGEIIVKYKESEADLEKESGKKKARSLEKKKGLENISEAKGLNMRLLKTDRDVETAISELEKDPAVEFAEPNYVRRISATPNDTLFNLQWGLHNTGQTIQAVSGTADADIDAPEAWDLESSGSEEIVVAVIDTGVRYTHEDLVGNMWDGSSCKNENGSIISGGCPNHGWDFKDADNDPNDTEFIEDGDDISGHGTFIAGIIAGTSGNSKGISGISKNNKIKIMALRFDLDTFSEVKAINFARHNGAKVINVSFGGAIQSSSEKTAIEAFGGIFVTASGNGGADEIGDDNSSSPVYPCDYASANIICVASTDQNDALSAFSNYGSVSVDIAAPGENIAGTYNTGDSAYVYWDGTSFAAPLVAGASALLFGNFPSLDRAEIKSVLLSSGDALPSLSGKTVSGKRLNLQKSLQQASALVADKESHAASEAAEKEAEEAAIAADFELYKKYAGYLKYEKKKSYSKYKKAKKGYGFDSSSEKAKAKEGYKKYKLFKKDPLGYAANVRFYADYKKYSRYKKNVSPVSKYSKYKKYDKSSYDAYKNYGTAAHKAGYDRYLSY